MATEQVNAITWFSKLKIFSRLSNAIHKKQQKYYNDSVIPLILTIIRTYQTD